MKRYIVCNEYSDYYKSDYDYIDLKRLLVEELKRYTFDNFEEGIVESNFKIMEKLILNDFDIKYIKEQLLSFGWCVLDLVDLQRDLSNYQAFKYGVGSSDNKNNCIEQTLKMIEEDLK